MPAKPRRRYRLRPAAVADLEEIWRFTADRWSAKQADTYVRDLTAAFARIADNPKIARERNELTPPVRILPCRSHIIVYLAVDEGADILRVRHGSEDWSTDPGGA